MTMARSQPMAAQRLRADDRTRPPENEPPVSAIVRRSAGAAWTPTSRVRHVEQR